MTFVPTLNTATLVAAYRLGGQRVINTFWLERAAAWTLAECEGAAIAFDSFYTASIQQRLSADIALEQVVVTSQQSTSAPQFIFDVEPPNPGNVVVASLPGNVAMVITLRTALRGRSFRGRLYLAGLPTSIMTGGVFTQASVDAEITGYETLLTSFGGANNTWVVVSKVQNGVPLGSGVTTPITNITADTSPDSQRRRLPGRGE